MQPQGELGARKSKQTKGKTLGFPWFSLAELGLFRGLRAKK
jgi:hypothetical protein